MGRRIGQLLIGTALGLAAYYTVLGGEYSMFELRAARVAIASESEALEALRAKNAEVRARAEAIRTDDATLEVLARDWGLIRDGEILYRYSDAPPSEEEEGSGR